MRRNNPLKEVFIFFGLVLGLSYFVFWGPLAIFQVPAISFVSGTTGPTWAIILYIMGGFVPSLSAILLTWSQQGRGGWHNLWQRIVQFNIGWQWYLSMVAIAVMATIRQLVIITLLGQRFDGHLFITQLGSVLPLLILGPLSEEIGWRGYALDRLQTRWNAIVSSMILGLVWGLWHLPLFIMVGTSQHELAIPFVGFVVGVMAQSIIYTWLHNKTNASIWTAIFFHWISTYSAQVIASGVSRSSAYNWLEYLPYIIIAFVVIWIWNPQIQEEEIAAHSSQTSR